MSVATEFSQFSSTALGPVPTGQPAGPGTPTGRPRPRLAPPAHGCVPGGRRVTGSRRGTGRVAAPAGHAPARREPVPVLETAAIGGAQFEPRPLRLTRCGMVVSAVGLALAAGLLLLVAHLSAGSPAARSAAVPGSVVTVQPGDTLWSIAGRVAPGHDPRRVVEQLRQVNRLSSVALTPGQTLKVG